MNRFLKISFILIVFLLVIGCGCNKKQEQVNKYDKVNETLNQNIKKININNSYIFENLDIVNDNTLETQIGIDRSYVEEYAIGIDMYNNGESIYMIIKPKTENKEIVKQALELYLGKLIDNIDDEKIKTKYKNALKEEYNGYYIYIVSDDNENVFSKIKEYLK
jgi:hypothetical protein